MSNTMLKNGKYEILKEIGAGAHGKIFLVRDTENDVKKALKQISNCDKKIQKEAKILQECGSLCPYILKYFDSFSDQYFNIVFEFHMFGDLRGVINDEINKKKSGVPSIKVKNWSKQQLEALDFIHSRNILHRDIKPENILLNNYGDVILGDFGVAAHADSISKTTIGSYNYVSPEILNGEEYDSRIDIWSFGCVVYELFTLKKAFDGSLAQLMRKITECEIEFPSFENEPEIEIMIKNSIQKNANDRLSAEKILEKLNKKNGDGELFKKAEKYYKEGELLIQVLKYKDALICFEKCLVLKEQYNPDYKIDISNTLDKIGECHLELLDYDTAIKYCEQAYEMRKDFCKNKDSIHLFNSLISLGDCYYGKFRYTNKLNEVLEFYLNSYEMIKRLRQQNLDNYKLDLAKSLRKIGRCYFQLKDYDESIKFGLEALKQYEKIYKNEDNKDFALTLNHLGECYSFRNDPKKGVEYNLKALKMRQRLYGQRNHSDIASSLFNLANNYYFLCDNRTALKYGLESLEMYNQLFNHQDRPIIATCLSNVGYYYFELGEDKKSLDFSFKALEMKKRLLKNQDDKETLRILNNIVTIYEKLNDEKNCSKYTKLVDELQYV